jgi:hypothetical protein
MSILRVWGPGRHTITSLGTAGALYSFLFYHSIYPGKDSQKNIYPGRGQPARVAGETTYMKIHLFLRLLHSHTRQFFFFIFTSTIIVLHVDCSFVL